ncbi:MAG: hypothetical protein AAGI38_00390 [Bacteroidota bacterium]
MEILSYLLVGLLVIGGIVFAWWAVRKTLEDTSGQDRKYRRQTAKRK